MTRRDPRRLNCRGLLVGLLALGSTPVHAAPARTVVLVRAPGTDHASWRVAEDRTRDELRMMGIGVVEVEAREDRSAIELAMAEHGALAAVKLAREGDGGAAVIWRVERGRGELGAVRIDGLAVEGRGAASVAALRAAELVRAQTQPRSEGDEDAVPGGMLESGPAVSAAAADAEVGVEPGARDRSPPSSAEGLEFVAPAAAGGPSPNEVTTARGRPVSSDDAVKAAREPAPPPGEPTPRRRERAFGVYAGIGGGPGGAGPLVGGGLALRWHPIRSLAIQADVQGATSPVWLSRQGHSLRVGLAGARAALKYVARPEARVSWRLGVGGGVTLAWALARSPDRLHSSRDMTVVGVLGASLQAAIRVRAHLRLAVGADVELLLPPVAVRVQGSEVARIGTPLVRGVLGIEWEWSGRARR